MDSSRIQAMFASGGGIDAAEARQLIVAANRDKTKLAGMLKAAGIPEDHVTEVAGKIHDAWSKANSGVTSDGEYLDHFKAETGGDGVLEWDPSKAAFLDQAGGSASAKGPAAVGGQATVPTMTLDERLSAIGQALKAGDREKARSLYAGATVLERPGLAAGLLKDSSQTEAVGTLLATDTSLVKVLEAASTPALRGQVLSALAEVVSRKLAGGKADVTQSQANDARLRIGQFFAQQPSRVETVLEATTLSPANRKAIASLALEGFATHATRSVANYSRLVKLLETSVTNPGDNAADVRRDVTRALRRAYYSDAALQFGVTVGEYEPKAQVTAAVGTFANLLRGGSGWQEIPSFDGKKVDVAHALVAADAYMNAGQFQAWVFTDFGDWASGRLSDLDSVIKSAGGSGSDTLTGAGNDNEVDIRGNDMGERIYDRLSAGAATPLSQLLHDQAP